MAKKKRPKPSFAAMQQALAEQAKPITDTTKLSQAATHLATAWGARKS